MDRQPTSPGADPSLDRKAAAAKAEDPFGGLESLEAEMARLLGREKQKLIAVSRFFQWTAERAGPERGYSSR